MGGCSPGARMCVCVQRVQAGGCKGMQKASPAVWASYESATSPMATPCTHASLYTRLPACLPSTTLPEALATHTDLTGFVTGLKTNAASASQIIAAGFTPTTGASSTGLGSPTVNTSSAESVQNSLGNWKGMLASLGRQFVTNTQSPIAGAISDNPQYSGYLQSVSGSLSAMGDTFAHLNAYSPLDALRAAFTQLSQLRNEINLNVHGLLNRQQLGANYTINITGSGEVGQDVINAVQYLQGLTV